MTFFHFFSQGLFLSFLGKNVAKKMRVFLVSLAPNFVKRSFTKAEELLHDIMQVITKQ